jgi:hypothetical protein
MRHCRHRSRAQVCEGRICRTQLGIRVEEHEWPRAGPGGATARTTSTSPSARRWVLSCESIAAEIIPHFRPDRWTPLAALNGTNAQTMIQEARLDRPVRFTGQLMFDASHAPCTNGTPPSNAPARSSSWEVHPVYAIDVCKSADVAACSASEPEDVCQNVGNCADVQTTTVPGHSTRIARGEGAGITTGGPPSATAAKIVARRTELAETCLDRVFADHSRRPIHRSEDYGVCCARRGYYLRRWLATNAAVAWLCP